MHIKYYRSLWGMEGSLREKLAQASRESYDGIEHHRIPPVSPGEWFELLDEFGLEATILAKVDDFETGRGIYEETARYRPKLIMSRTGLDRYDFERGKQEFSSFLKLESDLGIRVVHETHRQRMLFNPFNTLRYLQEFPELKLLADFSHWCVVCESKLDNMEEYLRPAIAASHHIHARVGCDQGPQVPDPSAPQYVEFLKAHLGWWDAIKAAREADGTEALVITPEFGPPRYMQTVPHTNDPLASVGKVCMWMREFLKDHWS